MVHSSLIVNKNFNAVTGPARGYRAGDSSLVMGGETQQIDSK